MEEYKIVRLKKLTILLIVNYIIVLMFIQNYYSNDATNIYKMLISLTICLTIFSILIDIYYMEIVNIY